MKFITSRSHGIFDHFISAFLVLSPVIFGMTGNIATFTYVIGIIHTVLTLFTDFEEGFFRLIPFPWHGYLEKLISLALITAAVVLFKEDLLGSLFFAMLGAVIMLLSLFTDHKVPVTAPVLQRGPSTAL